MILTVAAAQAEGSDSQRRCMREGGAAKFSKFDAYSYLELNLGYVLVIFWGEPDLLGGTRFQRDSNPNHWICSRALHLLTYEPMRSVK